MDKTVVVKRVVGEIEENKCRNSTICNLPVIENYNYCIKHILQDSTAPYKQCSYIYSNNGKQCMQAKLDEKQEGYSTYCFEHSRQSQLSKTRAAIGRYKSIDASETLMSSLSHHVKIDKVKPQSTMKITPFDEDEEIDVVTPAADPFIEINASEINNRGKNILDYASDSSSEDEVPNTLSNTWRNHELDNSDDESVDSADEDLLKYAGIYTVDEIATIAKDKMQRLQLLYMDQFERLKYVLREKRRSYLIAVKREKESYSNIHDQLKDSPRERKMYNKLKSMNHYHHRYGVEALLHRQYAEKRQKATEPTVMAAPAIPQAKNIPKCNFTEGGVKCIEKSIPCCKYCRKHIMEDKKQVLFKVCGIEKSGIVCQEPVVNIFEDSTCILHTFFPAPKTYIKRKYESETEEDEMDVSGIKKEKVEVKEEVQEVEMDTTTHENECIVVVDDSGTPNKTIKHDEQSLIASTTTEVIVE